MRVCTYESELRVPPVNARWRRWGEGFTLIELSVVLVIIGLLVGGVLVGRWMLDSSRQRAQVAQFQKFEQGMDAFKTKYGFLPGDIPDPEASSFGFVARGIYAGTGDGNGVLEGISAYAASSNAGRYICSGENLTLWRDLSQAKFIDADLHTATSSALPSIDSTTKWSYYPRGKLHDRLMVYLFGGSGQQFMAAGYVPSCSGSITGLSTGAGSYNMVLPSVMASIDRKIDDGMPGTGVVVDIYSQHGTGMWMWSNDFTTPTILGNTIPTAALADATNRCYHNNNVAGDVPVYSTMNTSLESCSLAYKIK